MMKENKKLKASMMKEEKQRIMNLVNFAYKTDPRLIAEEARLKCERERIKAERAIQREKEVQAEEERNRRLKFEFEENQRRIAQQLQEEKDEFYVKLIQLFALLNITLTDSDVFQIQLNINLEVMKNIISEVGSIDDESEKSKKLKTLCNTHYSLKFEDDEKFSTIWKQEDIILLQKAVKKYPAGVKQRWEKINEIVKTKPQSQIIKLAHFLATQPSLRFEHEFVQFFI